MSEPTGNDVNTENAETPPEVVPTWAITGEGAVAPLSLTFTLGMNAILDREKNGAKDRIGMDKWTTKAEGNPQPKYPYVFDCTYTDWESFQQGVETSSSWEIGKRCRDEQYEVNGERAIVNGKEVTILKEGMKAIPLSLPLTKLPKKVVVLTREEVITAHRGVFKDLPREQQAAQIAHLQAEMEAQALMDEQEAEQAPTE